MLSLRPAVAQSVTPDADADVVRLDARFAQGQYRPNQVIVKFTQSSRIKLKQFPQGNARSGVRSVDEVLRTLGVKRVEPLMPLTGAETFTRTCRAFNGAEVQAPALANAYVLEIDENKRVPEAVQALEAVGEVEYAEPNYLVHALATPDEGDNLNDPMYSQQYGIGAIRLDELWKQPLLSDAPSVIAILDTGVDLLHPDLKDNIWTNPGENTGVEGYDDDNNGYADDLHGYDFVNQSGVLADYNGHGTHCAGIAAATGKNGLGIIGANPAARIMPLTVLQSNGQGDIATIIKAVDYAAANGAQVLSMSFGSYAHSIALKQALGRAYQKAVLVAAAGNDDVCLNHKHPEKGQLVPMPMFPAAYNFVLGVQATNSLGSLTGFTNYDDNGPVFTEYDEERIYNYEVQAPGAGILSTFPNGQYKVYNGTSMATPLVAGAVSRLLQVKEYANNEELFGDLIHTAKGNLDMMAAYQLTEADRKPALQMVTFELVDTLSGGDGDGRPDAGEVVEIYPVIRNSWGTARNIRLKIETAEHTNNFVEFLEPEVAFGFDLNSYGKNRSAHPLKLRFLDNVVDGRVCRFKLTASADNAPTIEQEFEVTAENGVEIGGVLKEDMTLHAGVHYIVKRTISIPAGRTLTIEPGAILKFKHYTGIFIDKDGHLMAHGTVDKKITFTRANLSNCYFSGILYSDREHISDTLKYCTFINLYYQERPGAGGSTHGNYQDCEFLFLDVSPIFRTGKCNRCNIFGCLDAALADYDFFASNSNVVNNEDYFSPSNMTDPQKISDSNIFSNTIRDYVYSTAYYTDKANIYKSERPNYLGTSRLDLASKYVLDIYNDANGQFISFGEYDFSNMLTRPVAEAHGIVWKVVVNGYDAQDQFEELPPLGVGKHKFEVYFNRPMNKAKVPTIAMGVRPPYTQQAIAEDGSWNEAGDVYTAYFNVTGKQNIDGLNRIYVADAEDDEFFEIPVEKYRFNVNIQSAGSLSTGFFGEAGLGRVHLAWEDLDLNFEDIMGYNLYRINPDKKEYAVLDGYGNPIWDCEKGGYLTEWRNDTILLNPMLIEAGTTEYTDYDVVPGKTYRYYYKVMTTDMKENDPSKLVAVTPLTATKGDANGSGQVDVADVLSTVNYASGMNPKPFIVEAADMNTDKDIDIVDVVGIVNVIVGNPEQATAQSLAEATLTVEDGILCIDSPIDFAGVQFDFVTTPDSPVETLEALNGFETAGAWQRENLYRFLAYNLNGKTLPAGKHALLRIGQATVADARMSDPAGTNINVVFGSQSGIEVTDMDRHKVKNALPGIYNISGVKVGERAADLDRLPAGIYVVNGWKVIK